MENKKVPTFMSAMAKIYKTSDQKLAEFSQEMRGLDNNDREYFFKAMQAEGIECQAPPQK